MTSLLSCSHSAGTNFYLGMRFIGGYTGKAQDYEWLDGDNITDGYHNFKDTLIGQYTKQCAVWYHGDKAWDIEKCNDARNYVCQRLNGNETFFYMKINSTVN